MLQYMMTLLQRHFHADALNIAWVRDITEHWTKEGKLYLCAIKDLCSRRIVGYATGGRVKSRLVVAALNDEAYWVLFRFLYGGQLADPSLIIHIDDVGWSAVSERFV